MKFDRPVRNMEPKIRMGSGDAPAKVVKHRSKVDPSDSASPRDTPRAPKVRTGSGEIAVRIVKHMR